MKTRNKARGTATFARTFTRTLLLLLLLGLQGAERLYAQISVTYTSNGTFQAPPGVTQVTVECWGGGGRGAGRTGSSGRAAGGGGGAYARSVLTVVPNNTYTVTVGAGSNTAAAGGDSWFSTTTTILAKGGSSAANNATNGAAGGSGGACIGDVVFGGGNGANSSGSATGGGGSSAGTSAAGANATGQPGATAPSGGGDGGDGATGNGAGQGGSVPGGGGGGARRGSFVDQSGGKGGNGLVVITYDYTPGTCLTAGSANAIADNGCASSGEFKVGFPVSGQPTVLGTAAGNARLYSVELIVSHTWNSDIQVRLTSPTGQTRNLVVGRFGNGDNLGNPGNCPNGALVLIDGGAALTNTNTSNVTGNYAPEETLGGFTGDPNGTWTLRICDNAANDLGNFRFGRLNFCTVPQITSTTSNSPVCAGGTLNLGAVATGSPAPGFTWSGTGTFSPGANNANVSVTGAATGNYTVTASSTCGSTNAVVPVVVTTPPSATINYTGTPFCSNGGTASVTRTGTAGGTYSSTPGLSLDASSGAVNLAASTPGSYTVTYTVAAAGGCAQFQTTTSINITAAPSASISYAGSPFCSNGGTATVSLTGTAGGTYASTAGLSINSGSGAVDLAASTPGTYTVTYTLAAAGGCAQFQTTAGITITAAPAASISYNGSPYCSTGGTATVTLTGTAGGSYSSAAGLSINSGSGAVDLAASTPGTYSVTYTVAAAGGCAQFQTTASITINAPANAGSNTTPSVCSTDPAFDLYTMLGGTPDAGGSWTFAGGPVGNTFTPGTSAAGTYTYTVTSTAPCASANATVTVAVNNPTLWYEDADGDGFGDPAVSTSSCAAPLGYVANNTDQCITDPTKQAPGICGCDTPDDDTDGDGLADCIDPCPNSTANGDTDNDGTLDCDDLCPNDPNKIYPGACGCGNADVDSDGDSVLDCLDACPNDAAKLAPGSCGCGNPEPGMACDDNDPNTLNDVVNGSCQCVGTPVPTCVNHLVLDLHTDANGAQTSWSIEPAGGGAPLYQGNGYPSNAVLSVPNLCLQNGNYVLRVTDANGIIAPGGYALRMADGRRIIDNIGNGANAGQNAVVEGFTLPLGASHMEGGNCDRMDFLPQEVIRAVPQPAVSAQYGVSNTNSGYEWWFFNPKGGYTRKVFVSHATASAQFPYGPERATYLRLNSITTNPLPANVLLNVRVRPVTAGTYGSYGPVCRMRIITLPGNCITTTLITAAGPTMSCGATGKRVMGSGHIGRIYAQPAVRVANGMNQPANYYGFELTEPNTGYVRYAWSTNYFLVLGQWSTDPLLCGTHTYNVRVNTSFDGGATWCGWGPGCTVEITNERPAPFCTDPNSLFAPSSSNRSVFSPELTEETTVPELNLWPNPNSGDELYLSIQGLDTEATEARIEVLDLFGRMLQHSRADLIGSSLNTRVQLTGDRQAGLYLVNVIIGDQVFTHRLVLN